MANTWGTNYWGVNSFGAQDDVTLTLSGLSVATSISSSTTQANADAFPTTLTLTTVIQGAVAGASAQVSLTGIEASIVTGNEAIGLGVNVTGSSASTSISSVTIDDRYLVGEGWGRDVWGGWAWGVNYSVLIANGLTLTAVTGNEDAFTDVTVSVSGVEAQTFITPVGTSANSDHEIAASLLIQGSINSVSIEGSALVEPSGISSSTAIGDAIGGTIQEVPVTGTQLSIITGNEDAVGDANVSVTGISLSTSIGQASYILGVPVTGSSVTGSVGQVTAIGQAIVIPTGIGLTVNTITPNIIAWAEVDTGTDVVWTPVDLAA